MLTPDKEGSFWGRWHTPEAGTQDCGECCNGNVWEIHAVFDNNGFDGEDRFRVLVPGVERSQPLDAFEWGEEVERPDYARGW